MTNLSTIIGNAADSGTMMVFVSGPRIIELARCDRRQYLVGAEKISRPVWLFRPSARQRSSRTNLRTHGIDLQLVGAGEVATSPSDHSLEKTEMNRKTIIIAQILITLMMATLMSGTMSLIAMGPTAEWLAGWPRQALIAWPIAFIFTQLTTPLAFALAHRTTAERA